MKIKKSQLKRIIREEMMNISERVRPETLKINPEAGEFTVMADPDRPGEFAQGMDPRQLKGRIEKYGGRHLPKAVASEVESGAYFNPEYTSRQVSGMLSSQLRDVINQQMSGLGYDATAIDAANRKITKGDIMANALRDLISLEAKLDDQVDKDKLHAAIESILGVKRGFTIPDIT